MSLFATLLFIGTMVLSLWATMRVRQVYGKFSHIFGEEFGGLKIAHLSTADGVGIELFQFIKPKTYVPDNTFDYGRTGIFHICITAADIATTAAQIEANGGKLTSKIWRLFSNKDYKVCYCRDPWGTVIELNSHSYLQT